MVGWRKEGGLRIDLPNLDSRQKPAVKVVQSRRQVKSASCHPA